MSRLSELMSAVSDLDPKVGGELVREIKLLQQRTSYGLMFERHRPEAVELPGHPVRTNSKVRLLPGRGSHETPDSRLWSVERVRRDELEVAAIIDGNIETRTVARDDVLVVAEFSDRIYPGLRLDETVELGGDKPFHSVINGENFHVLEQLTFTHEHAVDVIYIDPPYNTGAKDWKYNNDYVVDDDQYRHSKWLAFMERRLKLAKRLLRPEDSVLIVTIDEKEYLRLGLLLEQTFPEAQIQMVSVAINPAAVARKGYFGRSDEYYFFVRLGGAVASAVPLGPEWVATRGRTHRGVIRWDLLRRSGSSPTRAGHPGTFYPIFLSGDGREVHSIGDPLPSEETPRSSVTPPEGTIAVWPIRQDGTEGRWSLGPDAVRRLLSNGYLRLGTLAGERTPIYYLPRGEAQKIESGVYEVLGRADDGSVITSSLEEQERTQVPGSQWKIPSHDSTQYGSRLLAKFLPGRKFPFPKSLYAVEDALRFFVSDKPDAVVLDFFAGSGTTAHAVMRLNRQDGGRRQCISVTNNEVSVDEQAKLRGKGLRPGDREWEQFGICDYITKPRIRAAITGMTSDNEPVKGEYKFVDEFSLADGFEENAAFMTLTYESPWLVSNDKSFAHIAPMLWLRAGARGEIIRDVETGWAVTEVYGILRDLDQSAAFIEAVRSTPELRVVFIVTDDEGRFQQVAAEIPEVEQVRLYAEYLRNCEITGDQS